MFGDPSRTLEGNSRKRSESISWVFLEFFRNFFRRVPAVPESPSRTGGMAHLRQRFKNEKAAQRVSFGAGYPADVHADIPADVRGQKASVKPSKLWEKKNKHVGADVHDPKARTSMTLGRVRRNFGQKNFGLSFCSPTIF